jgi:hypothetical protein
MATALSLNPANTFIQNARGHLLIRKGIEANTLAEAISLRDQGTEVLQQSIFEGTTNDPHSYHIYCSQRYKWIHRGLPSEPGRIAELDLLRSVLQKGVREYPGNRRLNELRDIIENEYLSIAVSPP